MCSREDDPTQHDVDIPRRLPATYNWLMMACLRCGHLGFSHDNAQDCAECECERFVLEEHQR